MTKRLAWDRRTWAIGLGMLALLAMPAGAAPRAVAIGDVSTTAPSWPLYIAAENGYFQAEGLEPETTYVGSNPAVVQQVVGGSLEIGVTTFETLIRAVDAGAAVKMIASLAIRYPYSVIVAPAIKAPSDLSGKSVSLPFATSPLTLFWNQWVTENGLDKQAVDQVYDGSTSNRFAALMSGTVAAAALTQPMDMLAVAKGYRKVLDYGTYAKNMGFTTLVASPAWLAKNPEVAKAYLRAVVKGVAFLYDPANREKSIAILVKAVKVDPVVAAQVYDYYTKDLKPFSPTLALPDDSVSGVVEEIRLSGALTPGDHAVARYVDRSYLP